MQRYHEAQIGGLLVSLKYIQIIPDYIKFKEGWVDQDDDLNSNGSNLKCNERMSQDKNDIIFLKSIWVQQDYTFKHTLKMSIRIITVLYYPHAVNKSLLEAIGAQNP